MSTGNHFLENTWYVAAWSHEIAADGMLARTITRVPLRFKWVWVWMGDADKADPSQIPDTHTLDDAGWRGTPGYLHYAANYLLITDNLLDFSHLSFVHETTLGGSAKYARIRPKVTRNGRSVRVERWLIDDEPAPFLRNLKTWPGNVDRWNVYAVVIPGVLLMDSGSAPTGTGAPQGARVDAAQFFGCQAVTPETETTSHYFFQQSHGFALDAPMLAMRMDTALASFRDIMEKAIAEERASPADTNTQGENNAELS